MEIQSKNQTTDLGSNSWLGPFMFFCTLLRGKIIPRLWCNSRGSVARPVVVRVFCTAFHLLLRILWQRSRPLDFRLPVWPRSVPGLAFGDCSCTCSCLCRLLWRLHFYCGRAFLLAACKYIYIYIYIYSFYYEANRIGISPCTCTYLAYLRLFNGSSKKCQVSKY